MSADDDDRVRRDIEATLDKIKRLDRKKTVLEIATTSIAIAAAIAFTVALGFGIGTGFTLALWLWK